MTKKDTDGTAVDLAIKAYRLACQYRKAIWKKWAPRREELRKLGEWNRSSIAFENDTYRSECLCEEAAQVLFCAVRGSQPLGVDPLKVELFEKPKNRQWVKAFEAYKEAFIAAHAEGDENYYDYLEG